MKKNTKRNIIITVLIMVSMLTILLVSKELMNKNKYPEEKINIAKNKSLAIMISEDGNKYKEYEGETWPEGYVFNKAECLDNKGNAIKEALTFNETTRKATVKSNKTIYCTLYFDLNKQLAYLKSKDLNKNITEGMVGDLYRYQGTYDKVDNNYICLGPDCSEYGEDLYRIIGVTKTGELKVIKKTIYVSAAWNSDASVEKEWPDTTSYTTLNTTFYNNLNSSLKKIIKTNNWLYGCSIYAHADAQTDFNEADGNIAYLIETGKQETQCGFDGNKGLESCTWNQKIDAPIGLMYTYDYYLAYPGGKPGNIKNAKNIWIHLSNNDANNTGTYEWLITRAGYVISNSNYASMRIAPDGQISISGGTNRSFALRPVFYLKNEVELEGEGKVNSPFYIKGMDYDSDNLKYLRSKDSKNNLTEDLVGDLYRYQGSYDKVDNNYICLGTDCSENGADLYRIIGINKVGELKVIKKTIFLGYQWHLDNTKYVNWANSDAFHILNDTTGTNASTSFYNNLSSSLKNLIKNSNWIYGASTYGGNNVDGNTAYLIETGQQDATYGIKNSSGTSENTTGKWNPNTDVVTAPVGLMYTHDYLLASPSGKLNNFANPKDIWIHLSNNDANNTGTYEWLLTRAGYQINNLYSGIRIAPDGKIGISDGTQKKFSLRPVFYLNRNIKLIGEGTIKEPFKIGYYDASKNIYYDYGYTGDYQTFTAPEAGTYRIELWGASGGAGYATYLTTGESQGGKGAYTKGEIKLNKNDKLYVYVGQSGANGSKTQAEKDYNLTTSYNGGGYGIERNNNNTYIHNAGSGGGATDIRLEAGVWSNFNSLKSRIMVAAGGGGGTGHEGLSAGGYGGALTGGEGKINSGKFSAVSGATQTGSTNGSFGIGANGVAASGSAGGGGGYYGGSSGSWVSGSGGSSYISGYNGCKAITKESTNNNITHSNSSEHYSNKVFTNTQMLAGNQSMPNYTGGNMTGNTGNGYARITKIN